MVGVGGSNPLVPTKQSRIERGLKGNPKGLPFLVWENFGKGLGKLFSFSERKISRYALVFNGFGSVARLVVLGQFRVCVTQQSLDVFSRKPLLFVQPRSKCPQLMKGRAASLVLDVTECCTPAAHSGHVGASSDSHQGTSWS